MNPATVHPAPHSHLGHVLAECRECDAAGYIQIGNGCERRCNDCHGTGYVEAVCECGQPCLQGRGLLVTRPSSRDEYVCGAECALYAAYGVDAAEVVDDLRRTLARSVRLGVTRQMLREVA